MNQGAAPKKKVLNPNRSRSPMKNTSFDLQFQSSTELAKQFQIMREKLTNEHNGKTAKYLVRRPHKRKNPINATSNAREEQSMQRSIQKQGSILPMHKPMTRSSLRNDLNTSPMIGRIQGEGEKQFDQLIDEVVKYYAPLTHKMKNPMLATSGARDGRNRQKSSRSGKSIQKQGSELPIYKSMTQSSSREDLDTSPMVGIQEQNCKKLKRKLVLPATSGARDRNNRQRSIRSEKSTQKQGSKLPIHKSMSQSFLREDLDTSTMVGIQEQSSKKLKRKPVLPAMALNCFLEKQGIHVDREEEPDMQPVDDVGEEEQFDDIVSHEEVGEGEDEDECDRDEAMDIDCAEGTSKKRKVRGRMTCRAIHARSFEEPDMQLVDDVGGEEQFDDIVSHEEVCVDEDECDRDGAMDIYCAEGGTSKKRKVRGRTTCRAIHARSFEEREEVTFDKGQAVGPTNKRVSDLSYFLGTIARSPRFITLLYTTWHAVPNDTKQRMWEYVNSKFIIPEEGKKWVMDGLRDAWRRHKRSIKKNHFDAYNTIEDRLKNRPVSIPENQFRQLIEYWDLPAVRVMCHLNSQNRKKQKWRHRMGPINFGRVRMALRATKDNNEEPSKSEIFIATRTREGKQVHTDTQVAIFELENRQNSGETAEEAFKAVFGKEQPGRIRCYGRSVTTSSLKIDEEISKLNQKHAKEVSSMMKEVQELREEVKEMHELKEEVQELKHLKHLFNLLVQNNPGLNLQDVAGCSGSSRPSSVGGSSARAARGQNLLLSSGSNTSSDS